MSMLSMHNEGFNIGLEAASKFLEATAADYDQMSKQFEPKPGEMKMSALYCKLLANAKELTGKAQLLRGQAMHIRELKA